MLATLGQLVIKADADATDQDVLRQLDLALIRADKWVKTYCKQELEAKDFTEYHDGGTGQLVLYQARASTITGTSTDDVDLDYGVWRDSERTWDDDTMLVANTDYRLLRQGDTGIIQWLNGSASSFWPEYDSAWWPCYGPETIRVIYRAGFEEDEIPDDLSGAVLEVALQMYLRDSLSLQSISSSQQAASAGGTVTRIKRGQSEIAYAPPSAASSSSSSSSGRVAAGTAKDPYGVNATLDLYKDWRR